MKKSELIFSALMVPVDFLMLVTASLAAYFLRFQTLAEVRPVIYEIPFSWYFNIVLIISFFWLIIFALSGLYAIAPNRRLTDEFAKIFLACSTGIMLVIIFIFFKREFFSSRFIILAAWIASIIFVFLGRLIIRNIQKFLYKSGVGVHKVIIIGNGEIEENIAQELNFNVRWGYQIIHRIKDDANISKDYLLKLKEKFEVIEEIIQANPNLNREKILELLDFCSEHHIVFKYATDLLGAQSARVEINTIAGIPIVEIKKSPLDGWGKINKRIFDSILSIIGLFVLFPFFVVIGIIIKLDSSGPIFVSLKRVGEKGKFFNLYKFRSMVDGASELKKDLLAYNERRDGPLFKMTDDPRITKFGKFIRQFSIDELPQLFNVLKGEMSLVGPRPHEPEEVAHYENHHKKLLGIKPGITGLAQISGRSDLKFEEETKLDVYYIENWSLKLDLQILFRTPVVVLSRKAAC